MSVAMAPRFLGAKTHLAVLLTVFLFCMTVASCKEGTSQRAVPPADVPTCTEASVISFFPPRGDESRATSKEGDASKEDESTKKARPVKVHFAYGRGRTAQKKPMKVQIPATLGTGYTLVVLDVYRGLDLPVDFREEIRKKLGGKKDSGAPAASSQKAEKTAGKTAETTAEKAREKTAETTAEKASEKTAEKTAEKASEKTAEKTAEKADEKGTTATDDEDLEDVLFMKVFAESTRKNGLTISPPEKTMRSLPSTVEGEKGRLSRQALYESEIVPGEAGDFSVAFAYVRPWKLSDAPEVFVALAHFD
ncbi:conserved hypothetical protein [Neospora caninum Liverpool]|uniref:Uncharacterized protein n=1 Tax=Neospora caninum (strain Liverpool) TaxID=572307 RepID=F0VIX2_NEOCL|nr:conserved hypothetical protein [Neospora caninum Liverpool]CBZ53683.1 conserved hypothetical protein [Neospora caninum Liverpool]CEL67674.1 TPA: hypothetical protein BN1204_034650 [Neospora caninum Liverpool]|eukprot:XP_003883715.1 conserved hypothetical protein [Neospora caninum Liverpool]